MVFVSVHVEGRVAEADFVLHVRCEADQADDHEVDESSGGDGRVVVGVDELVGRVRDPRLGSMGPPCPSR